MTRERLDQYIALKREVRLLELELQSLQSRSSEIVTDVVTGSDASFPYNKRKFSISGVCVRDFDHLARRRQMLDARRRRAQQEAGEIDAFIDSLEDSQMRQILLLKYLRGLSWRQVAMGIGGNNTEDGVRKRAERFLKGA